MNTGLAGRKVLITGAATGIGRATARAFAEEGVELALLDITAASSRDRRGLREGARTTVVVADLSTKAGVEAAFEAAVRGSVVGSTSCSTTSAAERSAASTTSMTRRGRRRST